MKLWFVLSALALGICMPLAAGDLASSATLVNALADRPYFSYKVQGVVQTRSLAPGNRLGLPAGIFSGLGEKNLPFTPGTTYYLARLGATPRVYRLPENQVLILNQSGLAIQLTLEGPPTASGFLSSGNLALGTVDAFGQLTVDWTDPEGNHCTKAVAGGQVYRLVLDSPDGVGTTVSLVPWE